MCTLHFFFSTFPALEGHFCFCSQWGGWETEIEFLFKIKSNQEKKEKTDHVTSLILSRFSLTSGSGGSPSLTPTTLGMGTGGNGLGPTSFFFRSSITLFFSVWISALSSSRDFRSFSFASCSARSWSARILSRRLSSSSLQEEGKR